MNDIDRVASQSQNTQPPDVLPQCYGSGWYEARLAGYDNAFRRYKRTVRECRDCPLRAECFEVRTLWALESRSGR